MGIKNLIKLIQKYSPNSIEHKKIDAYKNKRIGIDINLLIYKMIYAIRLNGYDIKNDNIIVTHIYTFLQKVKGFKKYNIKPIFVFDGDMPTFKSNTLEKRNNIGNILKQKYDNATTDFERKKYYYMKSKITDREIDDIITLINIFGYKIIFPPYEADCQLAYLQKQGLIDYVASDDMDLLVFGSGVLLKNFTVSNTKYITEINLKQVLVDLKISYDQFVEICMLMGCDYYEQQFGPIKSYKMIKEYGSMKNMIKNGLINDCNYMEIKKYFINSPVIKLKSIKWTRWSKNLQVTQFNNLRIFLRKYDYDDDKIDKICEKLI